MVVAAAGAGSGRRAGADGGRIVQVVVGNALLNVRPVVVLVRRHGPPDGPQHRDDVDDKGDQQHDRHDAVPQNVGEGKQRHKGREGQQAQRGQLGAAVKAVPVARGEDEAEGKGPKDVGNGAADDVADGQGRPLGRQAQGDHGQLLPLGARDKDADEHVGEAQAPGQGLGARDKEAGAALEQRQAGQEGGGVEKDVSHVHVFGSVSVSSPERVFLLGTLGTRYYPGCPYFSFSSLFLSPNVSYEHYKFFNRERIDGGECKEKKKRKKTLSPQNEFLGLATRLTRQ
ncbi:hypothetical protein G7054_g7378 [Neopestalotiopsis clavispora]|nr:hypothetical protein G7054_g7378 [Neopestalotiopsis clavispora]